jgi:hypothetical protein
MKHLLVLFAVILTCALFMGAQLTLPQNFKPSTTVASTFANSQVDTVTYTVDGSERLLGFYGSWADSVSVTNVITRRIYNGSYLAVVAGDTIIGATVSTAASAVARGSVPWTVPCEKIAFIVTYAGSGNGVTTPTDQYGLVRIR